jgi:hypothetical protein
MFLNYLAPSNVYFFEAFLSLTAFKGKFPAWTKLEEEQNYYYTLYGIDVTEEILNNAP